MTRFRRRSAPAPELRPEQFPDNDSFVRAVHDQGLSFDLGTLSKALDRRRALMVLGGGTLALAGCAAQPATSTTASSSSSSTSAASAASVAEIPEETAGPYPGDGSNGPDALAEDGIVRQDIRSSFGSSSTTAGGVPLTIELTLVDVAAGGPLAGGAVYLWHCDREGRYSMYSDGVEDENYLRGVQVADDQGWLSFTTVFPACYTGRWPHAHFEVFSSVDDATGDGRPLVTSQLALPEDVCTTVFATDGYEDSVRNLGRVSLDTDMVFSDGVDEQLPEVTGSVDAGYTASLTVGV